MPTLMSESELKQMAATMRRWIVDQSFRSGVGHIGCALSVVEILAVLWGGGLHQPGTRRPDRDRFILSKGHAALALYAAMRFNGILDEPTFRSYCQDGGALGVHPETAVEGIDLSTGSLGQGLSVGCGLAYGLAGQKSPARVAVLLSDAECNEGQVWEAVMFAAHRRLTRLLAMIDANGSQALGRTRDVLNLEPLAARFQAFGWEAMEIDGHDVKALAQAMTAPPGDRPRVIVARTRMGKGVTFMEDQVAWHYLPLTGEQHAQAIAQLAGAAA